MMRLFEYITYERLAPEVVVRPDQPRGVALLGTVCLQASKAGCVLNIARRVVKAIRKIDPSSVYGFGIRDNVKRTRPCRTNVDTVTTPLRDMESTTPLRSMESVCHTPTEQRARAA